MLVNIQSTKGYEAEALAMNTAKRKRKKIEIKQHRQMVYEYALDGIIKMIHEQPNPRPPAYATERFSKLKEVR